MADWPAAERETLTAWLDAAWGRIGREVASEPDPMALGAKEALWAASGTLSAQAPRATAALVAQAKRLAPKEGEGSNESLWPLVRSLEQEALRTMESSEWARCEPGEAPAMFEAILPALKIRPDWARRMSAGLDATRIRRDQDGLRFAQWIARHAGVRALDAGGSLWANKPETLAWLIAQKTPVHAASLCSAMRARQWLDKKGELTRELDRLADQHGLPAWSDDLGLAAIEAENPEAWTWLRSRFALDGAKIGALIENTASAEPRLNRYDDPSGSKNKGKTHPPISKERQKEFEATRQRLVRLGEAWDDWVARDGRAAGSMLAAIAESVSREARGETTLRWLLGRGAKACGVGGSGLLLRDALLRSNFPLAEELAKNGGWGPAAEAWLAQKSKARAAWAASGKPAAAHGEKAWARWEAEGHARWEARQLKGAAGASAEQSGEKSKKGGPNGESPAERKPLRV